MVRLKEVTWLKMQAFGQSFNSTMVRLKVVHDGALTFTLDEFQFHNGSIKRPPNSFNYFIKHSQFQFHNGSIKRQLYITATMQTSVFQFHNGSIKRANRLVRPIHRRKFQFHNGSIKS